MKRRDFLKNSGIVLGSASFAGYVFVLSNEPSPSPIFKSSFFTPAAQRDLLSLSKLILPETTSLETALRCLKKMDAYASDLGPSQKKDLTEALGVLDGNSFVKFLTGAPRDINDARQAGLMLEKWKASFDHFLLGSDLRLAYKALTDLFFLGFYSQSEGEKIAGYER